MKYLIIVTLILVGCGKVAPEDQAPQAAPESPELVEVATVVGESICDEYSQHLDAFLLIDGVLLVKNGGKLFYEDLAPVEQGEFEFKRCLLQVDAQQMGTVIEKECRPTWLGCIYE